MSHDTKGLEWDKTKQKIAITTAVFVHNIVILHACKCLHRVRVMQSLTSKEAVALDAVERLKNVVARRRLRVRRAVGRRALHACNHCACADRKGHQVSERSGCEKSALLHEFLVWKSASTPATNIPTQSIY